MKLICDFSFINNYVENFFSDEERDSAKIVNSSIRPSLQGDKILVISCETMDELNKIYRDRQFVLDTVYDLCEKVEIPLKDRIQCLIKIAAVYEIKDKDTFILAEDSYVLSEINKTTHKAISINKAIDFLKQH